MKRNFTVCVDRYRYLTVLDDPLQKRELIAAVEKPRSTVDRDVRLLAEAGAVERSADGYRLTGYGRLIRDVLSDTFDRFAAVYGAREIVEPLPPGTGLFPEVFVDATVVNSESHAPEKPTLRVSDRFADATRVRGVSPVVHPTYVEHFHRTVTRGEKTIKLELVLTREVFEHLLSSYHARFQTVLDVGEVRLFEADEVPHGLFVIERPETIEIVLVTYDRRSIAGAVITSAETAVEWAMRTYYQLRASSTEFPVHCDDSPAG